MKNFISMFLPFFIFLFLTVVLFIFLKGDNSTPCDGSYTQSTKRSKVQEIFNDVEVKDERKDERSEKKSRDTIPFFSSNDKLEITNVRWSKNHNGYERIVFDVSDYVKDSFTLGKDKRNDMVLHGEFLDYDEFLANLPSFSSSRIIKKMEVFSLAPKKGFSFTLWLYHRAEYKIFSLSKPSRIVIDIK
jgi:hypothetical protein